MSLVKVFALACFIVLGMLAIVGFIPMEGQTSAPFFHQLTADGWFPKGGGEEPYFWQSFPPILPFLEQN